MNYNTHSVMHVYITFLIPYVLKRIEGLRDSKMLPKKYCMLQTTHQCNDKALIPFPRNADTSEAAAQYDNLKSKLN